MDLLELNNMKKVVILCLILIGVTSCRMYDCSTGSIAMNGIKLGMTKDDFIGKYGQPFTFKIYSNNKDTIEELSYKTPKSVANCEFIVTTKLNFRANRLIDVSQKDFYIPNNAFFCDSTKVLLKK